MPRLFLGTYLNKTDQAALGQLPELNSTLETTWNCRVKWSKPNQLHLTWIFFGNIETSNIDNLCQVIDKFLNANRNLIHAPENSSLTYKKLECWFSHKLAQLIALVPSTVDLDLLTYANQMRVQLSEYAASDVLRQAKKPFKPHITLARLANIEGHKPNLPLMTNEELSPDAIDGLTDLLPLAHGLNTISLIESTERHGWHQYNAIKNFSLFNRRNH